MTHPTDLHFASDPDDLLCGRVAIRTLCGLDRQNTTNWNVAMVTCERCLEVMEDRAAGIERVTRVHDEEIIERDRDDPWRAPFKEFKPVPSPKPVESFHSAYYLPEDVQVAMEKVMKRESVFGKLLREEKERQEKQEMFARVKNKKEFP